MSPSRGSLEQIFQAHLQTLALTLRRDTVTNYRCVAHRFLGYPRTACPPVRRLAQLRRDPHLPGWFGWMCEQTPPLCNKIRGDYLLGLRRLLDDLAALGHPIQPGLLRREDFPPRPQYLPSPLPPPDDQLTRDELRRCLRQLGPGQWALHVPPGKLHPERLVPVDDEIRRIVARIPAWRALAPPARLARSEGFLPPRHGGHYSLY
jgi:hypothetical protein